MEQKVAIITGAAGGIGKAIVEKFLQQGYAVALVDINCQRVFEEIPSLGKDDRSYLVFEGNLVETEFLNHIVTTCLEKWGRIDALVNNAVWRKAESLRESSLEDWNRTLAVNITAPAFLSKSVAEELIKRGLSCVFINMSSVMADFTSGYATAYTVCKGALESLTYELATLYGAHGFRAVAIRPGSVETALSNDYLDAEQTNISRDLQAEINDRTPLRRAAKPAEIAEAVAWLSSPLASFITSTTLTIDGGLVHNFNSYALKKRLKPNEF